MKEKTTHKIVTHRKESQPTYALQLVMLGVVLGNKKIRESVCQNDFIDKEIGIAIGDLKTGGKSDALEKTIRRLGIIWNDNEGQLSSALIERLKLDAEYERAMTVLESMLPKGRDYYKTAQGKQKLIDELNAAGERLKKMNSESNKERSFNDNGS
jgi:hypothetical protein